MHKLMLVCIPVTDDDSRTSRLLDMINDFVLSSGP